MFQIISIEGINRALVPGEFRYRGRVPPVDGVQAVPEAPAVAVSEGRSHQHQQGKQGALVARYQSPAVENEPNEVLFVREIMTKGVITLAPNPPISEVTRLFSDRRYRHVPIISSEGKIVGLISDRDVLKYHATASRRDPDKEPVSSIMVSEVLVATPDTRIRDTARTMFDERIGSLPIIDERNSIVGIVTRSDIIRALLAHGPMRLWA